MQARDSIVFVVPLKCLQHWKVWEQYGTTCARPFLRPFFVEPLGPQSKDAGLVLLSRDTMASDQFRAKTLRQRIRRHRSIFDVSCELMRFLGGLTNPPTSKCDQSVRWVIHPFPPKIRFNISRVSRLRSSSSKIRFIAVCICV